MLLIAYLFIGITVAKKNQLSFVGKVIIIHNAIDILKMQCRCNNRLVNGRVKNLLNTSWEKIRVIQPSNESKLRLICLVLQPTV